MCSISWNRETTGLVVRFNRDEQRSRALGNPPVSFSVSGVPVVAPSDPVGGGTWFAVNSFGVVLALLNHHAEYAPPQACSRGLIIPGLMMVSSVEEAVDRLHRKHLKDFRPFQIVALDRSGMAHGLLWNGETLQPVDLSSGMLTSSSLETDRVLENRRKTWQQLAGVVHGPERFHSWRDPQDGAASVLMARSDARTVSRCRVILGPATADFFYEDLDDSGLVTDFRVHHLGLTQT